MPTLRASGGAAVKIPGFFSGDSAREYLSERTALTAPAYLLLAYASYEALRVDTPSNRYATLALFGLWIASFMKAPRAILYVALLFLTLSTTSHHVLEVALGSQNAGSDRDDAVIVGARALLAHQNPWVMRTQLDNPLTTGPLSFIVALPFVASADDITALIFLFWLALIGVVLIVDIAHESAQFPFAALIFHLGMFWITHSQRWRLEELSFGNLLFVPATWAAMSKRKSMWLLSGFCAALTLCIRPSYVFALSAFALWAVWPPERSWRRAGYLAGGGVLGIVVILGIVRLLSATTLVELYRSYAAVMRELIETNWPPWPKRDALFRPLNWLATTLNRWHLGRRPSLKVVVPMLLLLAVLIPATLRKRPSHPWWFITFAQLIAFGLASRVGNAPDYALPIFSAALLALAYQPREQMSSTVPV